MSFWMAPSGLIYGRVVSADLNGFFNAATEKGIEFSDVIRQDDLTANFTVAQSQWKTICCLAGGRGEHITVLVKYGITWTVKGLLKRPVLVGTVLLILILAVFLPTRVLFVQIQGNEAVSNNQILEAAELCGVSFGAIRKDLRSEKIKNKLLSAIPQLEWVGVNTDGCVAVISVRERKRLDTADEKKGVSSIIAQRDAVIRSITVTRGNALCKAGQAVKAGQILVSGYTDCGISIKAQRAEAEIFGETLRSLEVVSPADVLRRGETTQTETNYQLIFGKKLINLWKDSGISHTGCVKMYEEYYITLPGGLRLPIGLRKEIHICRDLQQETAEHHNWIEEAASAYLARQMVCGRVLNAEEYCDNADNCILFYGKYTCYERIGQVINEEIIKGNGKNY